MPNVRYSSGAIGTIRWPISVSFIRSLSSRTSAIVVAIFCLPEPCFSSSYIASPGSVIVRGLTRRIGTPPPSARRRSRRYSISAESSPGW